MSAPFTTRPVRLTELEQTLDLCLDAFADEPVTTWATSHRTDHREHFCQSLEAAVSAEEMIVAVTPKDHFAAASFWHHLDTEQVKAMKADSLIPVSMPDDAPGRITTATALTAARHPEEPHIFLSSMGALPQHRGQGAGGALIDWGIDYAHDLALPIYLEASTPQSRTLYLRKGFIDHGEPIELPQHGPVLQPMSRR